MESFLFICIAPGGRKKDQEGFCSFVKYISSIVTAI